MALKQVAIRGGVDLTTPAPMVEPGSLQDCLNYERGIREGMTRIDGFQRVDGSPLVSAYQCWRVYVFPTSSQVAFDPDWDIAGHEAGTSVFARRVMPTVDSSVGYLLTDWVPEYAFEGQELITPSPVYILFPPDVDPRDYTSIMVTGFGRQSPIASAEPITLLDAEGVSTADDLNAALDLLADSRRGDITTIPGNPGSDIIGGFFLKNRAYAIRDLLQLPFTDGLYTDANEGQFVTISGSEYEILAVTQFNGGNGFLSLDPVAGSGTDATGISSPAAFTITGTPPDCDVGVAYNQAQAGYSLGTTNGTAVEWSIVDDVFAESTLIDADAPSLVGQQTNAALWKADTEGFSRVELGREMLFSDGTANLTSFVRDATLDGATLKTTGNKFPTASTINGSATTGINSDNGTLTNLTGTSGDIFVGAGFDFSGIPSTAIIRGITVTVERRSDTANQAKDSTVTLVGITGGAENKARGTAWPNTIATATYGGSADLWGNPAITVADLQDADFGVMVIADRVSAGTAAVGGIDYIAVNVHYVERDTPAYVWDGTTDQAITIRHVQFLGGDTADSSAYGYITLDAPQNADKTRIINVGDQIRTAASGAGDLLATVAARDVPIWFPGQSDIDNNSSQYRSISTNFFASDQLDAAYVVCGVGPCVYYDGARAIRIRTQLPAQDDNPRHVARLGEKLALSYFGGALFLSQATNPFEMRTEEGAFVVPFGDRITGLRKVRADALLVPCEHSIQILTGLTNATHLRQTITDQRGMREYTDADMGIVIGCDELGLFDVARPPAFGPPESNYLSPKVAPWLQPRLQATDNAGQLSIRPIAAIASRTKNQHRTYFADGYVMTMTASNPIEITFQRYISPSDNDLPLVVRALFSGVDQSGRERIFASFRGAKEGYLFELDSGRSFDGDAIDAYLVLNPIAPFGGPSQLVKTEQMFVYGTGYGVANLTFSRATNFGEPDATNYLNLTMGSGDADATSLTKPFRGSVDFGIEGYDVTLRFDSSTSTEGPHCLQLTNLYVTDRGSSRGHTGN